MYSKLIHFKQCFIKNKTYNFVSKKSLSVQILKHLYESISKRTYKTYKNKLIYDMNLHILVVIKYGS